MAKNSWLEALIKGEYAFRDDGAVMACGKSRMRSACAKRVEAKETVIVRGMVKTECKGKAKEEEENLVRCEVCEVSL
jgi:hypothetical protein